MTNKVEIYGELFNNGNLPGTLEYNLARGISDVIPEIEEEYDPSSTVKLINEVDSPKYINSPENQINKKMNFQVETPPKKEKKSSPVKTTRKLKEVSPKKNINKKKELVFPIEKEKEKEKEKVSPLLKDDKTETATKITPQMNSRKKITLMKVLNMEENEEEEEATLSGMTFYRLKPLILPSAPSREPLESKDFPIIRVPTNRQYVPAGKNQKNRPDLKPNVKPMMSFRPGENPGEVFSRIVKEKLKITRAPRGGAIYSQIEVANFAADLGIPSNKSKAYLVEAILKKIKEFEDSGV